MKFADATNINRKSGVAKWRDLLCAIPAATVNESSTLGFAIPTEAK
jgi:hypothetical protein